VGAADEEDGVELRGRRRVAGFGVAMCELEGEAAIGRAQVAGFGRERDREGVIGCGGRGERGRHAELDIVLVGACGRGEGGGALLRECGLVRDHQGADRRDAIRGLCGCEAGGGIPRGQCRGDLARGDLGAGEGIVMLGDVGRDRDGARAGGDRRGGTLRVLDAISDGGGELRGCGRDERRQRDRGGIGRGAECEARALGDGGVGDELYDGGVGGARGDTDREKAA
jgi:hypothetical protein